MLTLARAIKSSVGAEQGMTLIELLVAMTLSIIVIGGLLATLEVSLRQEARISDRVQADRRGRIAMSNVIDQLHSSCTGLGTTAIQAPATTPSAPLESSNGLNLWFISAYGESTSGAAVITSVFEHDIHWEKTEESNTKESLGTLTDYYFESTGGTAPNWTFPALSVANAKTKVLATNVIPPSGNSIFNYYTYNTSGALASTAVPLTASTAPSVAKVTINFTQAPEKVDMRSDRTAPISDAVLLRFNPAETGTEAENAQCA